MDLSKVGKDEGREQIKSCYLKKGFSASLKLSRSLIAQAEKTKGSPQLNCFKGEVAETILQCALKETQRWLKPSIACHGICIPSVSGKLTAEIDVAFFTPQKLYLFECKCFAGEKVLRGKGTLQGRFSTAEIYDQSMGHLSLLFDYISPYLLGKHKNENPVQLVLFDGGLGPCVDRRDAKDKKVLPWVGLDSLEGWCSTEFQRVAKLGTIWDVVAISSLIKDFQLKNEDNIKTHIQRLREKRGFK